MQNSFTFIRRSRFIIIIIITIIIIILIITIITFIFDPKMMVQVTQKGGSQDNEIRTLTKGDYFGEQVNNDDLPLEKDWW